MASILSVFNNIPGLDPLRTAWGSSFFITTEHEKILFDTGSDSDILLHNFKVLNIDPRDIQKIVISHNHRDHTGALTYLLKENKGNIDLFLPGPFIGKVEDLAGYCRSSSIISKAGFKIGDNIYSSGTMGVIVREQAIVIDSPAGLIVITGCAHPGIIRICKSVMKGFGRNIYAVMGGFHLEYHPDFMIRRVFNAFRNMGIKRIGPNHCSGERALDILKRDFSNEFLDLSLGHSLKI